MKWKHRSSHPQLLYRPKYLPTELQLTCVSTVHIQTETACALVRGHSLKSWQLHRGKTCLRVDMNACAVNEDVLRNRLSRLVGCMCS